MYCDDYNNKPQIIDKYRRKARIQEWQENKKMAKSMDLLELVKRCAVERNSGGQKRMGVRNQDGKMVAGTDNIKSRTRGINS